MSQVGIISASGGGGGGAVNSVTGGTNINTTGTAADPIINLDDAITLATSVTSPLYTVASGDIVLNMTDDVGTNSVSFTNDSDAEVASIDSLGGATFTNLDVDNININTNTISSTNTNGDIILTPDGTGTVNISYGTQYTVALYGASGALSEVSGVGTSGQVLTSNGAGADPTWQDVSASGASSFPTDSGTATPTGGGALTVAGGTNINTAGAANTVTVNLDDAITVATSVSTPLYTVASGDLVLNMTDDIGTTSVSFTNNSDAEVAYVDSLGGGVFATVVVDNITLNGNTISSTNTNGDINLSPDGTGTVVINTDLDVDNINVNGNTISSTNVNGDINLSPNGTGTVVINTDLDVDNINVNGNTISSSNVNGDINLSPNGTGTVVVNTDLDVDNININGNTIISTDTNGDITLTPNGTGAVNVSYGTQYAVLVYGASGALSEVSGVGTSGQVLTSNGAGANPTWQAAGGGSGFTWNEETGTSATMSVDNGYIANNVSLVTLTLPTTAAVGSVVRVAGKGAGGWRIAQNAGETIYWDSNTATTTGATGSLDSSDQYDAVELVCITANTDWVVLSSKGNITIV